jgi:hypothetical protein
MADSFKNWSSDFISNSANKELLNDYQKFWHSTAHTNLDWIGPIADEIIEAAIPISGQSDTRTINLQFYHGYSKLNSDTHSSPVFDLDHYLGNLEEIITIPKMPYFLKIVLQYLENITRNYIMHGHSYLPVRESALYQMINRSEFQDKINQLGLKEKMLYIEEIIDEADSVWGTSKN